MKSAPLVVVLTALLTGCASPSVPTGYEGPTATIRDTFVAESRRKAALFSLVKIDGKTIDTSAAATQRANHGRGFDMDPVVIERQLPARPMKVTIEAQTIHAAEILGVFDDSFGASGEVDFHPEEGRTYAVKGVLTMSHQAVWIEDDAGKVVTKKIGKKWGEPIAEDPPVATP